MPLNELTEEQVRTMTAAEKDAWWLANVYRGHMPQLTLRSALTGMILGAVLSLSNLYVGVKIGAGFGVAITAVVLAFTMFKVLSRAGLGSEISLLENNCMQSIASSAGYMTSGLISTLPAYMTVTGIVIPQWQSICWLIAVALLGVLFAFPMKRRLINDEQLAFPEGRAAGVLMNGLHEGGEEEGFLKGKILAAGAIVAGIATAFQSSKVTERLFGRAFGAVMRIPASLDDLLAKLSHATGLTPRLAGATLPQLGIGTGLDLAIIAVGGLLGIQIGLSFLIGGILNYAVVGPAMIAAGEIVLPEGAPTYPIRLWSIWPGVAMLTTASLFSFFAGWRTIVQQFKRAFGGTRQTTADPLASIELPMSVFLIGIPLVGAVVVLLAHFFFGVNPLFGALAIPLVFILTLIGANTTGQTGQTPSGALGKITQLTFAGITQGRISTNIMTAGIATDAAINASSLLQDIKPGYMLGAKPRQMVIGHVLGVIAGALAATPVFYHVFLNTWLKTGSTPEQPMPAAQIVLTVARALTGGIGSVAHSALVASAIAGALGILLEMGRRKWRGKFPLHPIGIGFACVVPFQASFMLFAGAFLAWLAEKIIRSDGALKRIFVLNRETVCAAVVTGASIAGILVATYEAGLFG